MPSRRFPTHAGFAALLGLALALALWPARGVQSHALGVDKAELIEAGDGTYVLAVQIPPALARMVVPPSLPERCHPTGEPGGSRGAYEIRFAFACVSRLTADDTLVLPWQREGVMLTTAWADGDRITRLLMRDGQGIEVPLAAFRASSGSWRDAAERYLALGIEHILLGIDHLLFVLCLVFLVRCLGALVKAVTAFTVAHSLTLGLATLGLVEVPPGPVEAAIALSILFLAAEIIRGRQGRESLTHRAPWLVAFGFGLLHGLGFAGALSEVGLPPAEIPLALLFFNLGVEIGQLGFVAVVLLLRRAIASAMPRGSERWPPWLSAPAQALPVYAIGTMASFWFLERAGEMLGFG